LGFKKFPGQRYSLWILFGLDIIEGDNVKNKKMTGNFERSRLSHRENMTNKQVNMTFEKFRPKFQCVYQRMQYLQCLIGSKRMQKGRAKNVLDSKIHENFFLWENSVGPLTFFLSFLKTFITVPKIRKNLPIPLKKKSFYVILSLFETFEAMI
jgi:hypothetical protein